MTVKKEKKLEALTLYESGYTFAEVGQKLKVHESTAYRYVQSVLDSQVRETVQSAVIRRLMEETRLNSLMLAHWPNAMSGDIKASRIVLDCVSKRIALYGLNAPISHELQVENVNTNTIDELRAAAISRMSDADLDSRIKQLSVELFKDE
jgi:transposase-like protein